jgi:ectoine hydroxylase-related dioxygenase (phytanoyl-CoA dioxygenase family)
VRPLTIQQDNAYFKIADPLKGTAMWTAVHDANVANGTLRVIPGSHRESLTHSRDPQSDHHIRCYPDESRAVALELPAGGVAFFAYGVAHATGGNATDRDRAGAAYHFLNAEMIPPGYFNPHDPMKHPTLTGPEASDGTLEYGVRIAGTWDEEVGRVRQGTEAANPQ